MANDDLHKQEFRLRDLATRSVMLFPTRAHIIRDIKEITIQPGPNRIIIDGLAPTVDEHSIKVEGTGSATITDVTVDLLPNREAYEDIYPSEDDEDEDDDEEDSQSEVENEGTKDIVAKIAGLRVTLLAEQEKINSAASRLTICDNWGKSVLTKPPPATDLEKLLKAYNDERQKIYNDHELSTVASANIRVDIAKAEKEQVNLAKQLVKANEKKEKEKAKVKAARSRKKAEIYAEKQRIKTQRETFWPKKVYQVTINLELSVSTSSSRRSSISSIGGETIVPTNLATSTFHEPSAEPLKNGQISLSLSYITYSASWSPRYDLSLDTVKCTGLLEYGAELRNTTSETWRDAKVVLSTSQTIFSSLSETIPILTPWHVRLLKGGRNNDSALMSQNEIQAKRKEWTNNVDQSKKPRGELFGLGAEDYKWTARRGAQARQPDMQSEAVQQVINSHSQAAPQSFQAHAASSLFGQPQANALQTRSAGLFGSSSIVASKSRKAAIPAGSAGSAGRANADECEDEDKEDTGYGLFDGEADPNSLAFEAGAWEETGMTTTYDVPGSKTIAPSNSTIKHKIAKIDFRNVIFSHIIIGKLRQVAFLKARLRNTSKITLLKGPLGLTLDGSFLGQASFPRCSAGESFSLPLGVDPAISVSYPKPTVRRSQTGIFSKEDSNMFTRTMLIMNTKHNAMCELMVLDQVPISEDERLKIEITNPRGLKAGGESIRTGASVLGALPLASTSNNAKGNAKDARASVYGGDNKEVSNQGKWGTAIATAKKGGEVAWNVKLNPGQGVKLVLEYEAAFPGGEMVVGVSGHEAQQLASQRA